MFGGRSRARAGTSMLVVIAILSLSSCDNSGDTIGAEPGVNHPASDALTRSDRSRRVNRSTGFESRPSVPAARDPVSGGQSEVAPTAELSARPSEQVSAKVVPRSAAPLIQSISKGTIQDIKRLGSSLRAREEIESEFFDAAVERLVDAQRDGDDRLVGALLAWVSAWLSFAVF